MLTQEPSSDQVTIVTQTGASDDQEKPAQASRPDRRMFALGLGLTIALGSAGYILALVPGLAILDALTIALILGLIWRATFGLPQKMRGGVHFSAHKMLLYGIILTGVRLNFQLIASSGLQILLIDMLLIAFGMLVLPRLAQKLGVSPRLALLLSAGQSFCGASAVGAISALLPDVEQEEISLAVAICGLVGTAGVLLFTLAEPFLHLPGHLYGILAGSTLHNIAQVIAADPAGGPIAIETGLVTKLTRVMLLAPVSLLFAGFFAFKARKTARIAGQQRFQLKSAPLPWFILGFLAVGILNSFGLFPTTIANLLVPVSTFLLVMSMAAMGLQVDLKEVRHTGLKTLGISMLSFLLFVGLSSLLLVILHMG